MLRRGCQPGREIHLLVRDSRPRWNNSPAAREGGREEARGEGEEETTDSIGAGERERRTCLKDKCGLSKAQKKHQTVV